MGYGIARPFDRGGPSMKTTICLAITGACWWVLHEVYTFVAELGDATCNVINVILN